MSNLKLSFFAVLVTVLFSCQNETKIEPWKFRDLSTNNWLPAKVPGHVHTDLMANGLMPDPFTGTNEPTVKEFENKDWEYQTHFTLSSSLMKKDKVEIIFDGLDTYADVFLNDSLIIVANNMHKPWQAEVRSLLKKEKNELRVRFYSPVKEGQKRLEELPYLIPNGNEAVPVGQQNSVFSRKAQYHFGWDWGPRLVTSGIWRDVHFKGWNEATIKHVKSEIKQLDEKQAEVQLSIFTKGLDARQLKALITFDGADISTQRIHEEADKMVYKVLVDQPKYWWPNGMGEQHLYNVNVELFANGTRKEQYATRIGLRQVELVQNADSLGHSFYLTVNGEPIFLKGANYIPPDFFNVRATEKYQRVIQDALDANMNMLRIWGGAIYENNEFYDLCDEKGILIWQDFMSACAMIPTQADYLENFKSEAVANVQRLHNHPCVAIWCGNNENLTGWNNWGWQNTYNLHGADSIAVWQAYDTFFNKTLQEVVDEHGNGIYWPSSPSSGPNKLENKFSGDQHEWGIWFGQKPFQYFEDHAGRFISEYGLQSFPEMKSIEQFDSAVSSWELETPALNYRQRSKMNWIEEGFDGFDMMRFYIDLYLPEPKDLDDFVYLTQVNQALGLQTAIEAHRRNKPYTMGSLYWQIDDVWPTISWSTVDYYGRWKAAHYAVREANKPVVVLADVQNDSLKIHVVSDEMKPFNGTLKCELKTLGGELVEEWSEDVWVNKLGNKIVRVASVNGLLEGHDLASVFLKMSLDDDVGLRDGGVFYFVSPKDLNLEKAEIEIVENGRGVTLSSDRLVKSVALSSPDVDGHFSHNYFDLLPGEKKTVLFTSDDGSGLEKLEVRSLNEFYE